MFDAATMMVAGNAIAARITHLSLHSAGAVTSSADETTAARQPVTWTVSGTGDLAVTGVAFTGGAPAGAIVRAGYWTALTDGDYCGGQLIFNTEGGDAEFDGAGAFTIATTVTEFGTSA